MFSSIRRILRRAQSFAALFKRLEKIEAQVGRLEKLADENESLWQFIEEQKEMDGIFVGSAEDFQQEFTDIMIRNMKTRGDA